VAEQDRNLSLDVDPKMAWALANRHFFPVDVNVASREELLRIPGVGVRSVKRILSIRRHKKLTIADLKMLRIAWSRAKAFIITSDFNPHLTDLDKVDLIKKVKPVSRQLWLFDVHSSAASGEL
jgi:predicted DNA-binding helix-hairpin-helix protein